nr:CC chemokine-like protein [Oriental turtle dovepox virus]
MAPQHALRSNFMRLNYHISLTTTLLVTTTRWIFGHFI